MTRKAILTFAQLLVLLRNAKSSIPADAAVSVINNRGGYGDSYIVIETPDRLSPLLLIMCTRESNGSQYFVKSTDAPPYAEDPSTLDISKPDPEELLLQAVKEIWIMAGSEDADKYSKRILSEICSKCIDALNQRKTM